MRFREYFSIANILSLTNGFLGFFAIISIFNNMLTNAAIAIFVAAILDYLDGKIARINKTESELGKNMDSLSDIISFGIAPALLVWNLAGQTIISFILGFALIMSGTLRLARYNVFTNKIFYTGMPITLNGIIFPVVYFLNISVPGVYLITACSAFLMISNLKIKKI